MPFFFENFCRLLGFGGGANGKSNCTAVQKITFNLKIVEFLLNAPVVPKRYKRLKSSCEGALDTKMKVQSLW